MKVKGLEKTNIDLTVILPDTTPITYKYYKGKTKVTPDEKLMSHYLSPSFKSKNFEVYYFFKIVFHHDSTFEKGVASDPINVTIN